MEFKRGSALIIIIGTLLATQQAAQAKLYFAYEGKVGKYDARMLLLTDSDDLDELKAIKKATHITGSYFYPEWQRDIRLDGEADEHGNVTLDEFDKAGKKSATFKGAFAAAAADPKVKTQVLAGTWERTDGKDKMTFDLKLDRSGDNYTAEEFVDKTARQFRNALTDGDKVTVSELIEYPLSVHLEHKKETTKMKNSAELLKNYDAIFSKQYCDAIKAAKPYEMFTNYQGAMLGEAGLAWINPDTRKIKAVNNGDEELKANENESKRSSP